MSPMQHFIHFFGADHDFDTSTNPNVIRRRAIYNFVKTSVVFFTACGVVVAFTLIVNQFQIDHHEDTARKHDEHVNALRIQCISNWASAFSNRTNALVGPSSKRNDALDTLVIAFGTRDQAKIVKSYALYKKASATYTRLLKEHPVPPSPKFVCGKIH